jgi:hypothetical protein
MPCEVLLACLADICINAALPLPLLLLLQDQHIADELSGAAEMFADA